MNRPPLWNKSMARYLGSNGSSPSPEKLLDAKVLSRLGLKVPPNDPRMLAAYLQADDDTDGVIDLDEFARGIRRAVRLDLAFAAKLHRQSGKPWTEWVREHFKAGYECYRRYHRAAELQVGLISRNLPLLVNENQARALAPFRKHEKFWEAMKDFPEELPAGPELKQRVRVSLGLDFPAASSTARISLHRSLLRVLESTPKTDADPLVSEALGFVRRAIAILAQGS